MAAQAGARLAQEQLATARGELESARASAAQLQGRLTEAEAGLEEARREAREKQAAAGTAKREAEAALANTKSEVAALKQVQLAWRCVAGHRGTRIVCYRATLE